MIPNKRQQVLSRTGALCLIIYAFLIEGFDGSVEVTNNGTICPDEGVNLTCSLPAEEFLAWRVTADDTLLGTQILQADRLNELIQFRVFQAILTDITGGIFSSTLSTSTNASILEGTLIECISDRVTTSDTTSVVIMTVDPPSPPLSPRVSSVMNQPIVSLVTLQWDPPSDSGGAAVSYELTVSPTPLSGPPPSLINTSIQLSLDYNTNYNVSITANNCAGSSEPTLYSIAPIVRCSLDFRTNTVVVLMLPPVPAAGSMLAFSCLSRCEIITSTCGADGLWSPDPDSFFCPSIAYCTVPDPPSNGSIVDYESLNSTVAEGTVLTYQCDSGLVLTGTTGTIECGNDGRWSHDPMNIACIVGNPGTDGTVSAEAMIAITAVVSSLLSFVAGCLVTLLIVYLFTHKKSSPGEGQVNPAVVYDEVTPKQPIELKSNQAYGHIDVEVQAYEHIN